MRKLPLGFLVCMGLAGCAPAASDAVALVDDPTAADSADPGKADAASSLDPAQAQTVLRLIDNVCGDTWCDGDFDFRFKKIVCQPQRGSCTLLTFDIYPAFSDAKPSYFWRSCRVSGVSRFEDLVSTAASGYQTLTPSFQESMSECIDKIEASIPRN
jgi:hypothetical protein